MHGNSVGMIIVVVPSVVQEMLLTSESVTYMGCNLPMTVFLGICNVLFSVLSRVSLIIWDTSDLFYDPLPMV